MQNKFIYVANWKMYFSYEQEIKWINDNINQLQELSNENEIVICPSFVSLSSINSILNKSLVKLGAQNCSNFETGPYTGEIPIDSLVQLNCKYCIIGHSERRNYFNESNEAVAKKASLLISKKIIPIICIGETQYDTNKVEDIIRKEIRIVLDFFIRLNTEKNYEIIIAYEPIWAIGSENTPTKEYIKEISNFIKKEVCNEIKYKFIYGGGLNAQTASTLKNDNFLDGFLIGKASTDFQELKKIVLL